MCYVNFHCIFWMQSWFIYWFSFMSASIAIIRCLNIIHINNCFMSTYIAVICVNVTFVLCQLPLQLNFISTLFYVNFHCNFWMCWWDFAKLLDSFVLCQIPLQLRDRLISIISTLFHVNFHCTLYPCYLNSYPLCFMSITIEVFGCID